MKGFSAIDNPNHKGATDTWLTPMHIIRALGEFDLDPCGYKGHQTAKSILWSAGDMVPWHGRVWLNPPYSEVGRWLDMLREHKWGVALVFARTDTRWAQRHMREANAVFFLKGRIKFLNSEFKEVTNAGHGSMLLSYGEQTDFSRLEGWLIRRENHVVETND